MSGSFGNCRGPTTHRVQQRRTEAVASSVLVLASATLPGLKYTSVIARWTTGLFYPYSLYYTRSVVVYAIGTPMPFCCHTTVGYHRRAQSRCREGYRVPLVTRTNRDLFFLSRFCFCFFFWDSQYRPPPNYEHLIMRTILHSIVYSFAGRWRRRTK